jgi:diadenosine tetraphosphate (Ap4A) HIT family hydrolase
MNNNNKKPCMTCKKACEPLKKNLLKSLVSDHGTMFSSLGQRPNSKFHSVVMTKRCTEDLRTLTDQEWADILPVLKESINKVDDYYKRKNKNLPIGYNLSIPIGELASQNMPQHFYVRVVPKYAKDRGLTMFPHTIKYDRSKNFAKNKEKIWSSLQPNQDKVIAERGKFIAKLYEDNGEEMPNVTRESLTGIIAISTKNHLPNDINSLDQETWNEIGQMLKELIKKMEDEDACHDFNINFLLGKECVKAFNEESELPAGNYPYLQQELVAILFPRFKLTRIWDGSRPARNNSTLGEMENERLAEKLNNPEGYAKIWGKKSTSSIRGQEEETISQAKSHSAETSQRERVFENNLALT